MQWQRLEIGLISDERGDLRFLEFGLQHKVTLKRIFWIEAPDRSVTRGNHAHRSCVQILTCVKGEIKINLIASGKEESFILFPDSPGVLVEPMVWVTLEFQSPGSILLVGATEAYDSKEYISDWEEFLELTSNPDH